PPSTYPLSLHDALPIFLNRGTCCRSGCRNCPYPKTPTTKSCARCQKAFPCNPGNCWCASEIISVQALAALKRSFTDCLCQNCLKDRKSTRLNSSHRTIS